MAKKNAVSKETRTAQVSPGVAEELAKPGAPAPAPLKAGATAVNGAPKTSKPAGTRKAAAPKTPAKRAASSKPVTFSSDDISLRAYFIAEHRHRHGLHGDAHSDWIEAERQLRAEHNKAARSTKKPGAKKPA